MSATILPFIRRQPPQQEPTYDVDDIVDEAVTAMVSKLIEHDYDVGNGKYVQDIALVVESVKALIARSERDFHGLHRISDKIRVDGLQHLAANTAAEG